MALDAKFKAEVNSGTFLMNRTHTFEELSKKWLEAHAYPLLAPKTIGEYERLLSIINPKIGHYKLIDIKVLTLVEFYNSMKNRPGKKIQLSESSIQKYYALINAILNKGIQWEWILTNPNSKIDKPKREKKEAKYYDNEQSNRLLEAIENETLRNKSIVYLALFSGARRGELTGLEWEDIDFENNTIDINKTTQAGCGVGTIEKKPKNNSSIRNNLINTRTMKLLKELKKEQEISKKEFGSKWKNSKKIFLTVDGKALHPDRPSQIFRNIVKKYNLPPLSLHGLRHTHVSLSLNAGIAPGKVSKRVGHSTTATTLNIYSHIFKESDQEIVDTLDDILR